MNIRLLSLVVFFLGMALNVSAQQVPNPAERQAAHAEAGQAIDVQQLERLHARIAEAARLNDWTSVEAMRPDVLQATTAILQKLENTELHARLETYHSALTELNFTTSDDADKVLHLLQDFVEYLPK